MTEPWNVLLVIIDQWRADCLGALGHPCVRTPTLDALMTDGTSFLRHYTQASPCGPARASLFTGLYLHNHRSVRNGVPLDQRFSNLAREARAAGYDPLLFGYTDTAVDPRGRAPGDPALATYEGVLPGFSVGVELPEHPHAWAAHLKAKGHDVPAEPRDLWLPSRIGDQRAPARFRAEDSETAFLTDRALDHLGGAARAPWFLHLAYIKPHPPYVAPAPWHAVVEPARVPAPLRAESRAAEATVHPWLAWQLEKLWAGQWLTQDPRPMASMDDQGLSQLRATYYGLLGHVDAELGRVFAAVKARGEWDRTLVIVTADHGDQLGDHWLFGKDGWFEQSFHVPLIIRDPRQKASRGRRVEAFTEAIDLMPTVLEWLGRPVPRVDGQSLLPWLKGERPARWRDAAHWGYDFRDLREQGPEQALGLASEECCLTVLRDDAYKYVHFAALPPLLYDLRRDPGELRNLAADPAHAATVLAYAQRMLSWRMAHEERTLTNTHLGPGGAFVR